MSVNLNDGDVSVSVDNVTIGKPAVCEVTIRSARSKDLRVILNSDPIFEGAAGSRVDLVKTGEEFAAIGHLRGWCHNLTTCPICRAEKCPECRLYSGAHRKDCVIGAVTAALAKSRGGDGS